MDSFYGGRPGVSFTIKASFPSIQAMKDAFKLGPDYKGVWFGEYCLIDTPNNNDKDNGKIYTRGLEYQDNTTAGAQYVGQIVGPSSGTPYFQLGTISEVGAQATRHINEYESRYYPTGYQTDEEGRVTGYTISDGTDNAPIATFPFSNANDMSLVPGRKENEDGTITYNDDIKYTWCNIRQDNTGADSWFYVGFEIPYTVIDYDIHMVTPYDEDGRILKQAADIVRTDTKEHPFYERWNLGIPKGVKGDTFRNLRVMTPTTSNSDKIYNFSAISVDPTTGAAIVSGAAGYSGMQDDIDNARKILVYDYYIYDEFKNPVPIQIYLGDFNIIDDVKLNNNGSLTIGYTHNDDTKFDKIIKWVSGITLNAANGHFTMTFNNGDAAYETDLDWIKQITIDNDGTLHLIHTVNNRDEVYVNKFKWINDVSLVSTPGQNNSGEFRTKFNYGADLVRQLDWVYDINMDKESGDITVRHIDPKIGDIVLPDMLEIVTSASASTDGTLTFYTNTGVNFVLNQKGTTTPFKLRTIDDVKLNTRIGDDKHIQIKYNTDTSFTEIGEPINFIKDMVVRESDYHLLVLFSDPEHRVDSVDADNYGADGYKWYNNIKGSDGTVYGGDVFWKDFGAIKDQSGVLVGFNLTPEEITAAGFTNVIDYLDANLPNGLTGEQNEYGGKATQGKVVTYGQLDGTKDFYAFDYNSGYPGHWYKLGSITDNGQRDVKLIIGSANATDLLDLTERGMLFRGITPTVFTTSAEIASVLPNYWEPSFNNWV